jgi:hypothetical protein
MSTSYWIAKYVDDPFRNEPKNVGVIVRANNAIAARFFGEREEDGAFDARKIRSKFLYPHVYSQWRDFWRSKIQERDLESILQGTTANFYVVSGGEVTDAGADNAGEVCHFLYTLLVGSGAIEAFEWKDADESDVDLAEDITTAFREIDVLATSGQLLNQRHPVVKNQTVLGQQVVHTPSFSQQNGRLYVFEYINLNSAHINKAKERAGWMGYMFEDIKHVNPTAATYSLVRPEIDTGAEQIEYAKTILRKESTVINWSDPNERGAFLQERKSVAA